MGQVQPPCPQSGDSRDGHGQGAASGCRHAGRTHGPRRKMEEVDDPTKSNSYRVVRVFVYFDAIFGGVGDDAAADDAAPVETL